MNVEKMNKEYCVVRANGAGVFAGNLDEIKRSEAGTEVLLTNARRLWKWHGACSLSQIAQEGTKEPSACKFSVAVDKMNVMNILEILFCTKEAEQSIKGVSIWKS